MNKASDLCGKCKRSQAIFQPHQTLNSNKPGQMDISAWYPVITTVTSLLTLFACLFLLDPRRRLVHYLPLPFLSLTWTKGEYWLAVSLRASERARVFTQPWRLSPQGADMPGVTPRHKRHLLKHGAWNLVSIRRTNEWMTQNYSSWWPRGMLAAQPPGDAMRATN